jgi:hypothetical protein
MRIECDVLSLRGQSGAHHLCCMGRMQINE